MIQGKSKFQFNGEPFLLRNGGVVYALIVLATILTIFTAISNQSNYLDPINLGNILDQTSLVGILAVSMTVVLLGGNFDLSISSVADLSGAVALQFLDQHGLLFAFSCALLVGAAVGLFNRFLVHLGGGN